MYHCKSDVNTKSESKRYFIDYGSGLLSHVKLVDIKAETAISKEDNLVTSPSNRNHNLFTRSKRTLAKVKFTITQLGAIVRGPFGYTQCTFLPHSEHVPINIPATCKHPQKLFQNTYQSSQTITTEFILKDPRASSIAIQYDPKSDNYICGPSFERFSGHTGVCRILGSKKHSAVSYCLQLGDLIRLGSVGLVVTEINHTKCTQNTQTLDPNELEILKFRYLSAHLQRTFNTGICYWEYDQNENGNDENEHENDETRLSKQFPNIIHAFGDTLEEELDFDSFDVNPPETRHFSESRVQDEKFQPQHEKNVRIERSCYICYDNDNESLTNPLIAPCACKGDTKYVHLNCLKRWNFNSSEERANRNPLRVCVVTNMDGLHICSICKRPYATNIRSQDGRMISLLPDKLAPPYVTFAVVTAHEARNRMNALTNTRYQLSFAELPRSVKALTIGRALTNHMVIRYRTVSQVHAKLRFKNGQFYLTDASSSNGTLLFLKNSIALKWNETAHVKLGRTIITMKARKKWKCSMKNILGNTGQMEAKMNEEEDNTQHLRNTLHDTVQELGEMSIWSEKYDENTEEN